MLSLMLGGTLHVKNLSRVALSVRRAIVVGLIFGLARIGAGGVMILLNTWSSESALVVILDVPTLGAYWVLQWLTGTAMGITDAFDVRYHLIGVATWFSLGCAAAVTWHVVLLLLRRTLARQLGRGSRAE